MDFSKSIGHFDACERSAMLLQMRFVFSQPIVDLAKSICHSWRFRARRYCMLVQRVLAFVGGRTVDFAKSIGHFGRFERNAMLLQKVFCIFDAESRISLSRLLIFDDFERNAMLLQRVFAFLGSNHGFG